MYTQCNLLICRVQQQTPQQTLLYLHYYTPALLIDSSHAVAIAVGSVSVGGLLVLLAFVAIMHCERYVCTQTFSIMIDVSLVLLWARYLSQCIIAREQILASI